MPNSIDTKSKQWVLEELPKENDVTALRKSLNLSRPMAVLLLQRGIDEYNKAKEFFNPDLSQLHNPMQMQDMEKATSRLQQALQEGEKIMVYGDYDVDGTTSAAMTESDIALVAKAKPKLFTILLSRVIFIFFSLLKISVYRFFLYFKQPQASHHRESKYS